MNNGGPAFPVFPDTSHGHASAHKGMSLRDYIAIKCMQAFMTPAWNHPPSRIAEQAYKMADDMLKARNA
jgi:hypothetical protein